MKKKSWMKIIGGLAIGIGSVIAAAKGGEMFMLGLLDLPKRKK